MSTALQVLDARGTPIVHGSIVGMSDPGGPWSGFQGFVVAPFSELEGDNDGYTVAVFLGPEVGAFHFNAPSYRIDAWDVRYSRLLAAEDYSFLLKDDLWRTCPRIVFFQPSELVVGGEWDICVLAKRAFPRGYHMLYDWPKGVTAIPTLYQCFIRDCRATASRVALYNVWGFVYPLHVCDVCFPKTHKWFGDLLPDMKKSLLLANGDLVPVLV